MGVDPAPFWANLFRTFFSNNKVKAQHFHSTKRFTDDFVQ